LIHSHFSRLSSFHLTFLLGHWFDWVRMVNGSTSGQLYQKMRRRRGVMCASEQQQHQQQQQPVAF
jgi:hypothetical protein